MNANQQVLATVQRAFALQQAGNLAEAQSLYRSVLATAPNQFESLHFLGLIEAQYGRFEEAERLMARSLAVNSSRPEAHANYARILVQLDRPADALVSCERALALDPQTVDPLIVRGNALRALGRNEDSLASLDKALKLKPDHAVGWAARGTTLHELRRYDEALAAFDRALALRPNLADALTNRAVTLHLLGRSDEALASYSQLIAAVPQYAGARWNRSTLNLDLGRLEEGWKEFESRWEALRDARPRPYPQPRWNGGRVNGTLLVWGDAGLGDEILFAGMAPDLPAYADAVVLEVEPRLVSLFARSFPSMQVVPRQAELYPGRIDAHEPLSGLGRFLRRSWEAFPRREAGYLKADPERTAELRARLAGDGRFVVGLSWNSKNTRYGTAKSLSLSRFVPFLKLPGCRFVDLQYGETEAERTAVEREAGVRIEKLADIDNTNEIDGLAALIGACDLVLTVSNTTAHLAGALGRPTFVLISRGNARFWYWFNNREDSPWYASVRVFRQPLSGDWAEPLDRVRQALEELVASRTETRR